MRSERPDIRSERPNLRSERPDSWFEGPDFRSERPYLQGCIKLSIPSQWGGNKIIKGLEMGKKIKSLKIRKKKFEDLTLLVVTKGKI